MHQGNRLGCSAMNLLWSRSGRNFSPVCYIVKKVIAVSFSRPKMEPVFGLFFGLILIKIELEMKHDDFANLKFIALPR